MARRGPWMVTALALATSLACLFVLFVSGATAVTLPAEFEETTVLPGVGKPQDIAIAPNGRVFVAEKTGFIRTFESVDDTTPTLFADLRTQVHNYGSRGLLSIVADPASRPSRTCTSTTRWTPRSAARHRSMAAGRSTPCPKYDDPQDGDLDEAGMQPIGQVDNCPAGSRISRLQVAGEVMTGSEKVLVEDFCQQFTGHAGGGLGFDNDGKLIASASDGSTSQFWDWGQSGSPAEPVRRPARECGQRAHASGVGGRPAARAGHTHDQQTRRACPASVIRIDPATGAAVGTSGADANAKRIIAYGVRDATRLAVRPGTNDIWVADRGGGYWEEFHRVTPGSTKPNFGWPCYENNARREQSDLQNLTMCESLYADKLNLSPVLGLRPRAEGPPGRQLRGDGRARRQHPLGTRLLPRRAATSPPCIGTRCSSRTACAAASGHCCPTPTGIPKRGSVVPFAGMAKRATDLEVTQQGDLLYIDQGADAIRRIRYTPVNAAPTAVATANVTSGTAPLAVTFNGSASTDADGATR